jgi:hypothetical protein
MIKIETHPNFSEWLNISLWGKLIDNAKSEVQALKIAKTIQKERQAQGERIMIINHVEENN